MVSTNIYVDYFEAVVCIYNIMELDSSHQFTVF